MSQEIENKYSRDDKLKERFIRWQKIANDERGKIISLILSLSIGTIAFLVNLIINNECLFVDICCFSKTLILFSILILLICIVYLIIVSFNRLSSFADTVKLINQKRKRNNNPEKTNEYNLEIAKLNVRIDKQDTLTLNGVKNCLVLFAIGEIAAILGLAIILFNKLN